MTIVMVVRTIGIGRIFLPFVLVTYLLALTLNIISFSAPDWLVYTDVSIKIGLWRICDTSKIGYDKCADWNDRTYPTNLANTVFIGPPDYVKSSQGLEIISFLFYIITGMLLLFAILKFSIPLLFFIGAIMLLISVIFLSATLGIMCNQGRARHGGYLHFAWLPFDKMTEAASNNEIVNNGISHQVNQLNPPPYQPQQQQSSSFSYNHLPDTLSYGLMNNTNANSYPMLQHQQPQQPQQQQQYLDDQQPSTNPNYVFSSYTQPPPSVLTKLAREYVRNQMFNPQQQPAPVLGESVLENIPQYIDLQPQHTNQPQGYI
ncbi:unnamed protein product [Didymodactylos carnosus]|uniref:Uncharacterized protein n=1 Tax=Didymodactylos carnosus TaxID=1234261 RepID=A0A814XRW0_9BILA|nr:unnamed protein product [Didymodactylos carnosus]CAF1219568.1 unnamed protein product [Didymodactylos carnosus]CAF3552476.1 unnamed protein product [Didymodactylos carnosus]CAF3983094.1 unnamed protein product [Didymodactylos carnosus]